MRTTDYYQAIILVAATQKVMEHRRLIERACSYPPEYGGDEILMKRINEFMDRPEIQHEVKEALDYYKKLKEMK